MSVTVAVGAATDGSGNLVSEVFREGAKVVVSEGILYVRDGGDQQVGVFREWLYAVKETDG